MNLTTYLLAGYPGLVVVTSEEARAEAEIASVCDSLNRRLHAWSTSEGFICPKERRVSPCPDPLDALQMTEDVFPLEREKQVVLLRDFQLHLDQADPLLIRRLKDILEAAGRTVPLATLMDSQIKALRQWSTGRAREAGKATDRQTRGSRHVNQAN